MEVDRYLRIVHWARDRYTDSDGYLVKSVGRVPSVYTRIEAAAWNRYMK